MQEQKSKAPLSHFYLAGISYEKTNTAIRSLFAVAPATFQRLGVEMRKKAVPECFILSTCNRTEIYGFSESGYQLAGLLCEETEGSVEAFLETAYIKKGEDAVKHLFEVGCGLDSQILGDFEIISQVKKSSKDAREAGMLGPFTERLISSVLQASKRVKNHTKLSSGTVSVSYAVVQYLKKVKDIKNQHILLLGVGKIGQNACKNLMAYLEVKKITLVNRTEETARFYAKEHDLTYVPMEDMAEKLKQSDIILVATNAIAPVLHKEDICRRNKIIIDLSIPHNVSEEVKEIPGIRVLDVDELSQALDTTLNLRRMEIPKAQAIVEIKMKEFLNWNKERKKAAVLKSLKERMEEIHQKEIKYFSKTTRADTADMEALSSRLVQKMVNIMGGKLKEVDTRAEHYCQMLEEIFEIPEKDENI